VDGGHYDPSLEYLTEEEEMFYRGLGNHRLENEKILRLQFDENRLLDRDREQFLDLLYLAGLNNVSFPKYTKKVLEPVLKDVLEFYCSFPELCYTEDELQAKWNNSIFNHK